VSKYRIMYAKAGPARYLSHLDLLRAFERAARRAGLPLAFTRGYNPHPKISFAAPLGVGTAGEREFADLELAADILPERVAGDLSGAMPEGLRVIEVRKVPEQSPPLMSAVGRATYRAVAKLKQPADSDWLAGRIKDFLSLPEILVERKNKAGEKKLFDIKPGIFSVSGRIDGDIIVVEAELKAGSSGNVRFEEVLSSLEKNTGLSVLSRFSLCRTGLYRAGDGDKKKLMW